MDAGAGVVGEFVSLTTGLLLFPLPPMVLLLRGICLYVCIFHLLVYL